MCVYTHTAVRIQAIFGSSMYLLAKHVLFSLIDGIVHDVCKAKENKVT